MSTSEPPTNWTGHGHQTVTLPLCELEALNVTQAPRILSNATDDQSEFERVMPYVILVCYSFICLFGLVGNGLVIYVILMYAKMKTVTNKYILNLAISDVLFLVMLPFIATTAMLGHWPFGFAMCKIYFVIYSINLFGGAFTLCVMSADRYLAVCHPIRSLKYRTPGIALLLCLCIWFVSFLVMLPIILYSKTVEQSEENFGMAGKFTCGIYWPESFSISSDKAFTWYSFLLGFAIPVSLISVFYVLVILRLRHVGPARKTRDRQKSHRRVTRLVLTVVTVYIVCWLPHWCFQVHLVFNNVNDAHKNNVMVLLVNFFTILYFSNSMLNPFLYAFISENFRKSFSKAFRCASSSGEAALKAANVFNDNMNLFPRSSQTYTRSSAISGAHSASADEKSAVEMASFDGDFSRPESALNTAASRPIQDEQGFLKPPIAL
ncbi:somatostatin receptor type 1 [Plakobranchus ocellatus]|uniref:Somatostatin receptor type 1 n=1 Tax=Plakobranchus ocellatus TaxID=259542 RepID=A0AAV3YUX8_9GAST|nr:somatostatin receptor type 1 [Plakobranchus ocellatus]